MKAQLLSGEHIEFTSEDNIATLGAMKNHSGKTIFFIEFNAKIIHSSKTFRAFEKKLNDLIQKHGLQATMN